MTVIERDRPKRRSPSRNKSRRGKKVITAYVDLDLAARVKEASAEEQLTVERIVTLALESWLSRVI